MTSMKDPCANCLHRRDEHTGDVGCRHHETDKLGFVRDICECEGYVEDDLDISQERSK